jgi:two-component system chemotaxis response regulator CheB
LEDSAAVNRHKPSVDVLFNSLCPLADNVQAVLLTGMGNDGAQGMANLKAQGAYTIIQDKVSSLIWGMPGSAHKLMAHIVELPLNEIAERLLNIAALDLNAMRKVINESK